jgi:glutamate synthase domain-containing protein 2
VGKSVFRVLGGGGADRRLAAAGGHPWPELGWALIPLVLTVIGIHDMVQRRHAVLRNYPLIGHFRFIFESIRPELRQYFFEDEMDGRPFSRKKRSIVYQRAKAEVDSRPFGTELDMQQAGHEWIGHSLSPTKIASHDFRVIVGADRRSRIRCRSSTSRR